MDNFNLKDEITNTLDTAINRVIIEIHTEFNLEGFMCDTIKDVKIDVDKNSVIMLYKHKPYARVIGTEENDKLIIKIEYEKNI